MSQKGPSRDAFDVSSWGRQIRPSWGSYTSSSCGNHNTSAVGIGWDWEIAPLRSISLNLISSWIQFNLSNLLIFCSTIYLIGLIYQIDVLYIYIYICNVYAQSNTNQSDFKESIYPILSIITSYLVLLILSDLSAQTSSIAGTGVIHFDVHSRIHSEAWQDQ